MPLSVLIGSLMQVVMPPHGNGCNKCLQLGAPVTPNTPKFRTYCGLVPKLSLGTLVVMQIDDNTVTSRCAMVSLQVGDAISTFANVLDLEQASFRRALLVTERAHGCIIMSYTI